MVACAVWLDIAVWIHSCSCPAVIDMVDVVVVVTACRIYVWVELLPFCVLVAGVSWSLSRTSFARLTVSIQMVAGVACSGHAFHL